MRSPQASSLCQVRHTTTRTHRSLRDHDSCGLVFRRPCGSSPPRRPAPARAARPRTASAGTVSGPRTLPLIWTGTTTSSAFATSGIERRPVRLRQAVGVAEHLPQLFGGVRGERRHHHARARRWPRAARRSSAAARFRPRAARRASGAPCTVLAERVELVDELHQRRHRGIQVHPLFDVDRDAPDRLVGLAAQRPLGVGAVVAAAPASPRRRWSRPSGRPAARRAPGTRKLPSRPASLHSTSFSGGATNITYRRSASAPYFCSMSSGSTTLPLDFDITAPFLSTMPWVRSRLNGSSNVDAGRRRAGRA